MTVLLPSRMRRNARISPDGLRRYWLTRTWYAEGEQPRLCCFIMLNPSTADADKDDPTIRKCIGFAERLGFNGFIVVNLFAWRATDPADLRAEGWPRDEHTERMYWIRSIGHAHVVTVIAAWGAHVRGVAQTEVPIREMLATCQTLQKPPRALALTADGIPRHPLMLPYSSQLLTVTQ